MCIGTSSLTSKIKLLKIELVVLALLKGDVEKNQSFLSKPMSWLMTFIDALLYTGDGTKDEKTRSISTRTHTQMMFSSPDTFFQIQSVTNSMIRNALAPVTPPHSCPRSDHHF
jgi:hypothetical protein